jgi:hypothetical protein
VQRVWGTRQASHSLYSRAGADRSGAGAHRRVNSTRPASPAGFEIVGFVLRDERGRRRTGGPLPTGPGLGDGPAGKGYANGGDLATGNPLEIGRIVIVIGMAGQASANTSPTPAPQRDQAGVTAFDPAATASLARIASLPSGTDTLSSTRTELSHRSLVTSQTT